MTTDRTAGFAALREVLKVAGDEMARPELCVEEDGELCLDWQTASRRVLSVSIRADGRISWAALIGEWKDHASCADVPDERLRNAIRRWADAEASDDRGSTE